MSLTNPSCFRYVDGNLTCFVCGSSVLKNGYTLGGKQRFLCRFCKTSKVMDPADRSFGNQFNTAIVTLTKEGCGIRSTSRILGIAPTTVMRKILEIGDRIVPPPIPYGIRRVQVDEMHTFIHNKDKEVCVIYSWSQEHKQVLSLVIGTRSKANLRLVVNRCCR